MTSIATEKRKGGVRIILTLDRSPVYTTSFEPLGRRTKTPAKLMIDLVATKAGKDIPKTFPLDALGASQLRVKNRLMHNALEVSLELAKNAPYQVTHDDRHVMIDISAAPSKMEKTPTVAQAPPTQKGKTAGTTAAGLPPPAPPPKKQSATPVIVIDPGHGGEDTGAIGPSGVREKDVALAISLKLQKQLQKQLEAKVFLTRSDDRTLTLAQRNQIAVKHGADLFISIHANASTSPKVAGMQTYYLNNATDKAAEKLAERENRSAGVPLSQVQHILSTMQQNYVTEESRLLANEVHKAMLASLSKRYDHVHDLKVRSALFYVLVGTKCPGVLVETSFISNPREERRLHNQKYQADMAKAIAAGVARYLENEKNREETL